jgi:hypothetical protein
MDMTYLRMAALPLLLAVVSRCAGPNDWTASSEVTRAVTSGPLPTDVVGSRIGHFVTDHGTIDVPLNLSASQIGAWYNGTFYMGSGRPDGTFTIPNVPVDVFYLFKYNNDYVRTNARTLDLGFYQLGRPDVDRATVDTILAVNLDGLNPWGVADDLEITSLNAGLTGFGAWSTDVDGVIPRRGATSLVQHWDYTLLYPGALIDAGRGDQTVVHQLVTKYTGVPAPGVVYAAAAKMLNSSTLTVANRTTTPFVGTFTDVAQDQHLSVSWALSSFHEYGGAVGRRAEFEGDALYVDVLPQSSTYGWYGGSPDLVEAYVPPGTPDQTFDFTYGNPFPAEWGAPFVDVLTNYTARYYATGTLIPYTAFASIGVSDFAETLPANLQIQMSPPQNLQINGEDASDDLSGTGLTPILSWDTPAVGTPSYYRVTIRELRNSGGETIALRRGLLYTDENSIMIPPGVLVTGGRYFMLVTATNRGGPDFRQSPYQTGFPYASGSALTGVINP